MEFRDPSSFPTSGSHPERWQALVCRLCTWPVKRQVIRAYYYNSSLFQMSDAESWAELRDELSLGPHAPLKAPNTASWLPFWRAFWRGSCVGILEALVRESDREDAFGYQAFVRARGRGSAWWCFLTDMVESVLSASFCGCGGQGSLGVLCRAS